MPAMRFAGFANRVAIANAARLRDGAPGLFGAAADQIADQHADAQGNDQ
jgi:hypothetical protein